MKSTLHFYQKEPWGWLIIGLLALVITYCLSGCKPKQELSESSVINDSIYHQKILLLQTKIDSFSQAHFKLRTERNEIERQLAVLIIDELGQKDSTLPVKELKRYIGTGHVFVTYQGEVLRLEINFPECVIESSVRSDSVFVSIETLSAARDSLSMWEAMYKKEVEKNSSTVVQDPRSRWERFMDSVPWWLWALLGSVITLVVFYGIKRIRNAFRLSV